MILEALIQNWVPQYSKVIDLGCGDGTLLESLHQLKSINPYGVEIDQKKRFCRAYQKTSLSFKQILMRV